MKTIEIENRTCYVQGSSHAACLVLQMTGDHELQELSDIASVVTKERRSLYAAIPVKNWNTELSPWEAPPVWGKEGFGGLGNQTLCFLLEQVIPKLKRDYELPDDVKIILGGYSLAGLFSLWASTQTDTFCGIAAASPSVWFPKWMEWEAVHPMQARKVYLSLGNREEQTKNQTMKSVGDHIRLLYSRLVERQVDCVLEWNPGGHFKETGHRTAQAFLWTLGDL